jgi:pantoate--beta-alanine ligase
VVSIFVNPAQFAPSEDFSTYPRTFDSRSLRCWRRRKPTSSGRRERRVMYPEGFATRIVPEGPRSPAGGQVPPGLLQGRRDRGRQAVHAGRADIAVFGEKDYQQLKVVTRMARDLDLPLRVIGARTVRERDRLAMSSRNVYLTATRARSRGLYAC